MPSLMASDRACCAQRRPLQAVIAGAGWHDIINNHQHLFAACHAHVCRGMKPGGRADGVSRPLDEEECDDIAAKQAGARHQA